MGFPRIKYGANLDKSVDFDIFPVIPSRADTVSRTGVLQAGSGIEEHLHGFEQGVMNLAFRNLGAYPVAQLRDFKTYAKDGSSFQVEFDRALGGFCAFENTVNDNDGATGTFTRDHSGGDTAHYLNPVTGLITESSADTPRFVAGKYGTGYLSESERTNLITHPSDFSNAAWSKSASITVDAATTVLLDPDGGNNASRLTTTAATQTATFDTSTTVSTNDAAFSIWMRAISGTETVNIDIRDDSGTSLANNDETVTTTWQEFEINYNNPGSNSNNWSARVAMADSGTDIAVYGTQFEVGADVLNATTIIDPLSTTSITRNGDKLTFASTYLGQNKGTIGFWFRPNWVYNEHTRADLFTSGTNDSNKHLYIQVLANGNISFIGYRLNDGTQAWSVSTSGSGKLVQDTYVHLCFVYDFTVSNGCKICVDGVLANTSSNDPSVASGVGTSFALGSTIAGGAQPNGVFDEFFYTDEVLSITKIADIASGGSTAFGRNRMTCTLADFNFPIEYQNGGKYNTVIPMKEVLS